MAAFASATGLDIIGYIFNRIQAVFFDGTFYFDLHHTAEDTLDKIEASDLDYNTAAYAALLYLVAEYEGRFDAKEL